MDFRAAFSNMKMENLKYCALQSNLADGVQKIPAEKNQ